MPLATLSPLAFRVSDAIEDVHRADECAGSQFVGIKPESKCVFLSTLGDA
jgi:hypothetical protein